MKRKCRDCGKVFEVEPGKTQYLCRDCYKRAYMAEHKEESQALKADTRGKRYICPICGKEFERHTQQATCSPECERELKRIRQNEADIRRGKRKLPAADRRKTDLPQSGVPGVNYNRRCGKWQVSYKGKYIGLYESLDQAIQALDAEKVE